MATEKEMERLYETVRKTGVKFVDTSSEMEGYSEDCEYNGDYASDLSKQGMMNDKMFEMASKKFDWGYIKQVMDVSDERYGDVGCKMRKTQCDENKKREKMTKVVELLLEIMKDE